jgi:hypothetical protein
MNQIVEITILSLLLLVLLLKPSNVANYIKTHIGRILMASLLVYLTLRNYIYGVVALAIIVLVHEMNIVEGNTNMTTPVKSSSSKKMHLDNEEDETSEDDSNKKTNENSDDDTEDDTEDEIDEHDE